MTRTPVSTERRKDAAKAGLVVAGLTLVQLERRRRARGRLGGRSTPGTRHRLDARPRGAGLHVVVNPDAGPMWAGDERDKLVDELPEATVVELHEGDDLPQLLEDAVRQGAAVLGMAGGDGSQNTAARGALDHDLPLAVVPAGTLNHLARDLGLLDTNDTITAVQEGRAVEMDVGEIDGRIFLNTASFGGYVDMVDAREQLERIVGKWPAVLVALYRVLRRCDPVDVELDGRRRKLWLVFIGNGEYEPRGFVPSRRARLDDDWLDVRLVDGTRPYARTRLLLAVLTGTLRGNPAYEELRTEHLEVRSLEGPLRLAVDGETFDGSERFTVRKCEKRLVVYTPLA